MTDNEQGYTPTTEQVRHRWVTYPHTPTHSMQQIKREEFDRWLAATLAAHRGTLVVDNREALVDGIAFHFNGWFANGYNKTLADRLANEAIDHLLASGVVQATTPTETDDTLSVAITRLTRLRAYLEGKSGNIVTPEYRRERDWGTAELESLKETVGLGFIPDTRDALLIMQAYAALASRPAPVAPEQPTQANEEWRGEWDIHPDSVSKLTGATYREVVSDVRRRQSLNDDQAQHAIDKNLFDPPALVSSPSVETVTPDRETVVRDELDLLMPDAVRDIPSGFRE